MAKRPIAVEDLLHLTFVSDPQIHPDGGRVLFQRKTIAKNKYQTALLTVDPGGRLKEWTRADLGARHGRWSPDGAMIAFISERDDAKAQICLIDTDGGEAKPVTAMPEGDFAGFRWSPDSRRLAPPDLSDKVTSLR